MHGQGLLFQREKVQVGRAQSFSLVAGRIMRRTKGFRGRSGVTELQQGGKQSIILARDENTTLEIIQLIIGPSKGRNEIFKTDE
jgi:hypothetical protein